MELKEKEATSYSFGTQFEPSDEPVKRPLDDNDGVVIVETALSAEKPVEEQGVFMYKRIGLCAHLSPTVIIYSLKCIIINSSSFSLLCTLIYVSVIS